MTRAHSPTMRWRVSVVAVSVSLAVMLVLAVPGPFASRTLDQPKRGTETIPGECRLIASDEEIAVNFIDQGGPKGVHLLLDRTVVRPGEQLLMAPRNLSRRPVSYGLATGAEEAGTGRPLRGTALGHFSIGLTAEPGGVGPCATLEVPNTAALGEYNALLKDVDGAGLKDEDLKAPFTIAGEPLHAGPYVRAGARSVGPRVDGRLTKRELNRASNRIAKVLRDEPARSWGMGYGDQRRLFLDITELTVKGLARIERFTKVPLRIRVESGP